MRSLAESFFFHKEWSAAAFGTPTLNRSQPQRARHVLDADHYFDLLLTYYEGSVPQAQTRGICL